MNDLTFSNGFERIVVFLDLDWNFTDNIFVDHLITSNYFRFAISPTYGPKHTNSDSTNCTSKSKYKCAPAKPSQCKLWSWKPTRQRNELCSISTRRCQFESKRTTTRFSCWYLDMLVLFPTLMDAQGMTKFYFINLNNEFDFLLLDWADNAIFSSTSTTKQI